MKKYEKPKIFFENLEFNTGIAACSWVIVQNCTDLNPDNQIFETPFQIKDDVHGGVMTYFFVEEGQPCTATGQCYDIPVQLEGTTVGDMNSLS